MVTFKKMSECRCVFWRKALKHTRFYLKSFGLIINLKKAPMFSISTNLRQIWTLRAIEYIVIDDNITIKYSLFWSFMDKQLILYSIPNPMRIMYEYYPRCRWCWKVLVITVWGWTINWCRTTRHTLRIQWLSREKSTADC